MERQGTVEYGNRVTVCSLQDLANAIDKASRAGYTGPHGMDHPSFLIDNWLSGNFSVPVEIKIDLDALYHQVTVGDYGRIR